MSRRLRLLVVTPVLVLGPSACGSGAVAADDAATRAADVLEEQVGFRPEIECPEDLPAEVGAEIRCTLTAGDDPEQYGLSITVTSVEGDTVNFDVEVDQAPLE